MPREKYKILDVEVGLSYYTDTIVFVGFELEGVNGVINPFNDTNFNVPDLEECIVDILICDYTAKKQDVDRLNWAREQIGKYLHVDSLKFMAVGTTGEVEIKE